MNQNYPTVGMLMESIQKQKEKTLQEATGDLASAARARIKNAVHNSPKAKALDSQIESWIKSTRNSDVWQDQYDKIQDKFDDDLEKAITRISQELMKKADSMAERFISNYQMKLEQWFKQAKKMGDE